MKYTYLLTASLLFYTGFLTAQDLKMKYLGTAGWEIRDGETTVLIDPYISRLRLEGGQQDPNDTRREFKRNDVFVSDTALIDRIISDADYIFVHHSHFDHIADVPYIAKKTGAKVIATNTARKMLRAYGVPEDQLYAVKGGEDYQFEGLSVRVIPSIHSALNEKHYFDDRTFPDDAEVPLRVTEFIEGGSLMFLVRFSNHNVMTMGSMNFIEREIQGITPDILLAGVNLSSRGLYNYEERLLAATGNPRIIIPTHWDNWRLPYGYSQESVIDLKIKPFIEKVKNLAPESKVLVPTALETLVINP